MSRHTTPAIEIGRLKLEETPDNPSRAKRLPDGKLSSTSQYRRAASSQHPSSGTGSRSSRTTPGSGSAPSTGLPSRQLRASTRQQRAGRNNNAGGGGGSDNGGNSSDEAEEQEDLGLRVRELMATFTDSHLSSVQIPSSGNTPTWITADTQRVSALTANLLRLSVNPAVVNAMVAGFDRLQLIAINVTNFQRQSTYNFQLLEANISSPQQGFYVDRVVQDIARWERAVLHFVVTYGNLNILTDDQKSQLFTTVLHALVYIVHRNRDLYNGRHPGQFFAGHIHEGNLYQKWRIGGDPQLIFDILSHLRAGIQVMTNAASNRGQLLEVRDTLRQREEEEEDFDDGPITWELMKAALHME